MRADFAFAVVRRLFPLMRFKIVPFRKKKTLQTRIQQAVQASSNSKAQREQSETERSRGVRARARERARERGRATPWGWRTRQRNGEARRGGIDGAGRRRDGEGRRRDEEVTRQGGVGGGSADCGEEDLASDKAEGRWRQRRG